jgi:hypothetical protein
MRKTLLLSFVASVVIFACGIAVGSVFATRGVASEPATWSSR